MTMPDERRRAVRQARDFLRSLLDPKKTPRVPRAVRREAYWALRHYPGDFEFNSEFCWWCAESDICQCGDKTCRGGRRRMP